MDNKEMFEYPEAIKNAILEGKSPDRVPKHYLKYPADWKAEYNMLLPDGVTCIQCHHCDRCVSLFGQKAEMTRCQFYPSRAAIISQTPNK